MAVDQTAVSGILWTDQADFYPDPYYVARLHPTVTPFITDLFMMTPDTAPYVDYKMFQKEPTWKDQYFQINNGSGEAWDSDGTPADTNTVTVDGAIGIEINSSLQGRTAEVWNSAQDTYRGMVRIQSVTNSTTVVLESVGNPSSTTEAIADLQDDDYLFINGSAYGEVETSPDAYSFEPDLVWNSMQHHRTSLEISYDLANAALRGVEGAVSKLMELQTDKMDEHKLQLERSSWTGVRRGGIASTPAYGADSSGSTTDSFGGTHIPDSTNGRVRTTMGLISAIRRYGIRDDTSDDQSYFVRTRTSYTYANLVDDMEKVFNTIDDPSRAGVKDAYCGPGVYGFWSKFVLENMGSDIQLGTTEQDDNVGYHFRRLETPHGLLRLIKCPDWKGRYSYHMAIPAKRFLRLKILTSSGEGTDDPGLMGYFPDIKTDNRPLVRKDEYHSHCGLDIRQMKAQYLMQFN